MNIGGRAVELTAGTLARLGKLSKFVARSLLDDLGKAEKAGTCAADDADDYLRSAIRKAEASGHGYLNPGIGAAAKGQFFRHVWITHDLYNRLRGLIGKADFNKFVAALKKGVVGPNAQSGIKILASPIGKYTHELTIGGSAQRLQV